MIILKSLRVFEIQDSLFQRLSLITILRALSGIKVQFSHSILLACEQSVNRAPDVMFLCSQATFPCSSREFSMTIYSS